MEVSSSLILEVWELISEYLQTSKKEDVANKLIKIFADKGMESEDFESIRGEDNYLDTAIDNFLEVDTNELDEYDYEADNYDDDD
jgi:hypothetical protein